MEKLQMLYEQMIGDDDLMKELEEIIVYAADQMKQSNTNGTEIYEFVEDKLTIFPVGLVPLETVEGYFLLSEGNFKTPRVYQYQLSFFEKHDAQYRSIRTTY